MQRRHIPIGIPIGGVTGSLLLPRGKRSSGSLIGKFRGGTQTALQVHGHQAVLAVAWQNQKSAQVQAHRQAVWAVAWQNRKSAQVQAHRQAVVQSDGNSFVGRGLVVVRLGVVARRLRRFLRLV